MAIEPEARRRAHEWMQEVYGSAPEREALFETISGEPVKPLYTPDDRADADPARLLRRRRREEGNRARAAGRDDPDRHPQGVQRPEGVVLPDPDGAAPRRGHDRVVLGRDAALAPDLDQRLPHPRGR